MPVSRKALCLVYAFVAVLALVGCWANNIQYLHLGLVGTNVAFLRDTLANPASRSVTADLLFLLLAVFIWMVLEARRLGMRRVWLYLLFGAGIAISVTVPIFLINRERALATKESRDVAGTLSKSDIVGLVATSAVAIAYTVFALAQGAQ
jgi:hypothetical protein